MGLERGSEGDSGAGLKDPRGFEGCLSGGVRGDIFASKCILKVEYAKEPHHSGLGNHPFCPGIPRFWQKLASSATITLKVIVITYETFKLIVEVFETLSKNAQKPRKIKEK